MKIEQGHYYKGSDGYIYFIERYNLNSRWSMCGLGKRKIYVPSIDHEDPFKYVKFPMQKGVESFFVSESTEQMFHSIYQVI